MIQLRVNFRRLLLVTSFVGAHASIHALPGAASAPVYLDSSLSSKESQLIRSDYQQLSSALLEGIPSNSNFTQVFGTPATSGVVSYLNARVKYVISDKVDLQKRIGVRQRPTTSFSLKDLYDKMFNRPQTIATNIGTVLWFASLAQENGPVYFQLGQTAIPVNSSRVGIVRVGRAYSNGRSDIGVRQNTWVHEARHSDCTGGLNATDYQKIKNNQVNDLSSRSCGHLHVLCPQGHSLAGSYACDAKAWGAYSIGAVYSANLARHCSNCTAAQKKAAQMMALDSFSRVLVNTNEMMAGKLGRPNMSSSTTITP